jgi:hypothetical protein
MDELVGPRHAVVAHDDHVGGVVIRDLEKHREEPILERECLGEDRPELASRFLVVLLELGSEIPEDLVGHVVDDRAVEKDQPIVAGERPSSLVEKLKRYSVSA